MMRRSRFHDDAPETAFAAATTRINHNIVDVASRMHATPMSAVRLEKRLPGCVCHLRAMAAPSKNSRWPQAWQANCSTAFVTNNSRNLDLSSSTSEFYTEQKWCDHCNGYVRFMMSVNHSYCIECGGRVRLFNRNDSANFQETVQRHKWQAS